MLVMKRKMVSAVTLTLLLTSMLTLAFNVQPVKAEPKTWYVDDSGGADFTRIQDAIYAASAGDTIYVYNGTYCENLRVYKDNLTIMGEIKSNTIIDGGGKVVIEILSKNVVVSGFTVRNGGQSWYYVFGSAIVLENDAQSCIISDNIVSSSRYGITSYYGRSNTISGNTISDTNQGVPIYYTFNETVIGNIISDGVQVGSDPPYGIQVYGGLFNLIMENIVTNINYTGIRTTYTARNVIMGNTVTNTSVGVEIWGSNNNTVVDNSISTSTDRGISLEISYNNKIIGNTLSDNNYGINVGTSHDNEVSDNTVANCTNEGIMMGESFSNTVTNNTITESNIAVYLGDSYSNNISENMATSNAWGLWLVDSKDNEANHNKIMNNRGGILVLGANSSGNIIRGNIIKNTTNAQGAIFLHTCNNNTIYHNNFVENVLPQIFNYASVNIWDDNYPSGGNYWSDYTGVDANGDGIGDSPYIIDADNQDRYPLMHPWSPLPVHNINTGLGYATIQEAINAPETLDGHTIFVETGTYYEHVVVNKSISLMGEDNSHTVIEGNGTGKVVLITANNVSISGFAIRYSGYGVYDAGIWITSNSNNISNNHISNNSWGISLEYATLNIIKDNVIDGSWHSEGSWGGGIILWSGSNNNLILDNVISCREDNGIFLQGNENQIIGNTIMNYYFSAIHFDSNGNILYHNNFMEKEIYVIWIAGAHIWDNGYPSGGNYWSDYVGVDVKSGSAQDLPGSDGIGDTPYIIDADNHDHYPLMNPYGAPPPPTYSLTITATVGGTTDPAPGTYTYTANSQVQVTAFLNTGYLFDHWELDSVNVGSANPYTVLMNKNPTLKAIFSHIKPSVPVGGHSIPIQVPTKTEPIIPYIALIATLTAIFTKLRPKTKRKR
jgi:parallel beta-helix repeat protein